MLQFDFWIYTVALLLKRKITYLSLNSGETRMTTSISSEAFEFFFFFEIFFNIFFLLFFKKKKKLSTKLNLKIYEIY